MCVDVIEPAERSNLLDLEHVRARLSIGDGSQDQLLGWLIEEVSALVVGYLGRPLARQRYRETIGSVGEVVLQLSRMPVEPTDLLGFYDDEPLTGVILHDRSAGLVRQVSSGFGDTRRRAGRFTRYPSYNEPESSYAFEYWAGYLLPGDDIDGPGTPLPADIRRAALLSLMAAYQSDGRDSALAEEQVKTAEQDVRLRYNAAATAIGRSTALTAESMAILGCYPRAA